MTIGSKPAPAPATDAPGAIASFDSASVMAMAVGMGLRRERLRRLGNPAALHPIVRLAGATPRRLREKLYVLSGAMETISPRKLDRIDPEELSRWVIDLYPDRTYPRIAVGSSNGALSHLYTSVGMPWLPQTLLLPVRQRVHPDDPVEAYEAGLEPADRLLDAHPELQLHHMHDANQDRLMVRALTYFRVKRRTLGAAYERFLLDHLEPGGTIVVVDCRQRWSTTRVGPRHVFQHGALGGATEQEFHEGSERVADYLERYDSPVREWDGPEPDTSSPEAEWGYEPALDEDVERFAEQHGFRVERIVFDEPMDASPFVADLHRDWHRRRGLPADRLIVSSFMIMDHVATLRVGGTPFWIQFNMEPSLAAIEGYLDDPGREPYDEIRLALFQHGVEAVGLPSIDRWREVLGRAKRTGSFLGLRPEEHPLDFPHLARYDDAMDEIPARYPDPPPLPWDEVLGYVDAHGDRYAIEIR
jgi:hypothetical protein